MILKKCLVCGIEFSALRKTSKYCSNTCKMKVKNNSVSDSVSNLKVSVSEPEVIEPTKKLIETNEEETRRLYNESIQYFETHILEQTREEGRWVPNRYKNGK